MKQFDKLFNALVVQTAAFVLAHAQEHPIVLRMPEPKMAIDIPVDLALKGQANLGVGDEMPRIVDLTEWACAHRDNYMLLAFIAFKLREPEAVPEPGPEPEGVAG